MWEKQINGFLRLPIMNARLYARAQLTSIAEFFVNSEIGLDRDNGLRLNGYTEQETILHFRPSKSRDSMVTARHARATPRKGIKIREVDEPPYETNDEQLQRYDQKNLIFRRAGCDPDFAGYGIGFNREGLENIQEGVLQR